MLLKWINTKKKVLPMRHLLYETNYVLGDHCLRLLKKKMHFALNSLYSESKNKNQT